MTDNQRQQRLIERVQEDERLRGDLGGAAATALVEWASAQVRAVSADPSRPDAEVEQAALAVRQAASQSARSGETEPANVIALAETLLQQHAAAAMPTPVPQGDAALQPAVAVTVVQSSNETGAAPASTPVPQGDAALQPAVAVTVVQSSNDADAPTVRFGRVRHRWGERIRRWLNR